MALRMECTTPDGDLVKDAYCRIESIDLRKNAMSFRIRRYRGPTGVSFFSEDYFEAPYDLGGANPFEQAYAHVKAQPEYADATDDESVTT